MTELESYFKCEAYEDDSSVYVIDGDGLKLFSSSNTGNKYPAERVQRIQSPEKYAVSAWK